MHQENLIVRREDDPAGALSMCRFTVFAINTQWVRLDGDRFRGFVRRADRTD